MNIRRGLFRLWVIFFAISAAFSFCIFFHDVQEGFAKSGTITILKLPNGNNIEGIPADISLDELRKELVQAGIAPDEKSSFDLSAELAKAPRAPSPWAPVFEMLFFALGLPLLVLILGRSLFWVASGFYNKA